MIRESLRVRRRFSRLRGRHRMPRPKTFTTEESAHAWAKEQGFKNYSLEDMHIGQQSTKKIRVTVEI